MSPSCAEPQRSTARAPAAEPGSAPGAAGAPGSPSASPGPGASRSARPAPGEAADFVAEVERRLRQLWVARDQASWVTENFITDDTEALAAAGEEATAAFVGDAILRARRFDPVRAELPPDVARKLYLLPFAQTIPAPRDAGARAELAAIETSMTAAYGKGLYCPPPGSPLLAYAQSSTKPKGPGQAGDKADDHANAGGEGGRVCLHLDELSRVLRQSRKPAELAEAWRGWHATAAPMKAKYARYVELANQGATEIGFADVGALWRGGYDMSPEAFEADIERLWTQVRPLYEALHCYVRAKLKAVYGKEVPGDRGPIPAHLLGNMWAQEWNNVYDLVAPYPAEPSLDVGKKLKAERWDALKMVRQGEKFFTALGFDPLPATFWQRSLFVRPRDREVVCHASAWDVTWSGDLRIKMCIEPTEEDFVTIHHELGHDFYFQRYEKLPILFQQGANDGFHEAIGDTMALSVTPEYLRSIGLLDASREPRAAGGSRGAPGALDVGSAEGRARMNQ
ncbi:MAG: M2 family metallopeptidase, partial [Myxococcales bacterium]|nr:M2 family metallopeptidase [Myxococcales bacterium]